MTIPADQPTENPTATLLAMIRGYWISQAIFVAARLDIADHLNAAAQPCSVLAERTGVPEQSLYRLLRALASIGVLAETSPATFELTELGQALRKDVPGSLRDTAIYMGDVLYPSWGQLQFSIENNQSAFQRAFGNSFFSYLDEHPETAAHFQATMANLNHVTNMSVPESYDFSGAQHLIDIGGGNGSLLASILKANPVTRGTLFDLPSVMELARANLEMEGVIDRCELVGGDFFSEVPQGGDVYLLRWILHDYDDDRAIEILRSCRKAMDSSSRLLVLEHIVNRSDDPNGWISTFLDLQMLILFNGRERTEDEFRAVLARAGFQLERVIPTSSPLCILDSFPR